MPSHEDDEARRAGNEAVVRRIMSFITAGTSEKVLDELSDDVVFELPYAAAPTPSSYGKEVYAEMQSQTFAMFNRFALEPIEFHPMADPDGLVVEYRSDAEVKRTGKPYLNRYIGVFKFQDGKIVNWREFHNPDTVTEAFKTG